MRFMHMFQISPHVFIQIWLLVSKMILYYVDPLLFNKNGRFIVDRDIHHIIQVDYGNIALDNVNLTLNTANISTQNPNIIAGYESEILLVDSYIAEDKDIAFYDQICNVVTNQRLSQDNGFITLLLINCTITGANHGGVGPWVIDYVELNYTHLDTTMNSTMTQNVSHLSQVQIAIIPPSTKYFPGQLLTFDCMILDKIGNVIHEVNLSKNLILQLTSNLFSASIEIQPNGECPNTGILITSVSILHDINSNISITTSIVADEIYSSPHILTLNVIGCPLMYGPADNGYTCIACNDGYYNIIENSVEDCKSCGPDDNPGITCTNKKIIVNKDYWMEIKDDMVTSSICPSQHCCSNADGCDYIHDDGELCALNRDTASILCGKCIKGYSESPNSTKCVDCKGRSHLVYLLIPMIFALFITLILVATNTEKIQNKKQINAYLFLAVIIID